MKHQSNPSKSQSPKTETRFALRKFAVGLALSTVLAGLTPFAEAGYALYGQGMQVITNGSMPNAALFLETRTTWLNGTVPEKPYTVGTGFTLPACDAVGPARLVLTVWGGTAAYACQLQVRVNGTNLPGANPLNFGTTGDANLSFSPVAPNVYGGGSGVWLVSLPVPSEMLLRGASNTVEAIVNTADSLDGRIQQITLCAVYQQAALSNTFQFALAEGSGDLYTNTTSGRVAARSIPLGTVNPTNATAARLHALYTYGDVNQNDRLFFNALQLGGNNVADYDKAVGGFDFAPDTADFDILSALQASNSVKFTVSANDGVPWPGESTLRPSLAILEVTSPPAVTPPALAIALNVVISWPASAERYQLEFRPNADAGEWTPVTNAPLLLHGQNTVILPSTNPRQFYQLRKTN